jgi:hypothetical protein
MTTSGFGSGSDLPVGIREIVFRELLQRSNVRNWKQAFKGTIGVGGNREDAERCAQAIADTLVWFTGDGKARIVGEDESRRWVIEYRTRGYYMTIGA